MKKTFVVAMILLMCFGLYASEVDTGHLPQLIVDLLHEEFMSGRLRNYVTLAEQDGIAKGDGILVTYSDDEETFTLSDYQLGNGIRVKSGSFVMARSGRTSSESITIETSEGRRFSISFTANLADRTVDDSRVEER